MPQHRALVAKLKAFLAELTPATRAALVRNLDKARLQGREDPIGALVLEAARLHAWETGEPLPRVASAMRRFFAPLDPFLIGEVTLRKQTGRIARASLTPIWTFLLRDVLPDRMRELTQAVLDAALADDEARADALAAQAVDEAVPTLEALLADADIHMERHRRLAGLIDGERVYDDFKDAVRIFALRDEIRALLAEAPAAVVNPSGAVALLMPLLEDFARGRLRGADAARGGAPADRATDDAGFREHLTYGLAALQHRFADPMRILALAVAAAGSDEVARLERSPYGAAVDLALAEIDRAVQRLAHVLSAKGDPAGALKRFHGLTRAFGTTLDMDAPSAYRMRLTELRALASDLVAAEIEHAPALIRRALDPVDSRTQRVSGFDRIEAEHAVFAARLFTAARLGADALAINDLIARLRAPVERAFEAANEHLPNLARGADRILAEEALRRMPFALDAAAALFGEDYAAILRRSFAAAIQDVAKAG